MISDKFIYDTVSRIPSGKVATYGQIAQLIKHPTYARYIGHALSKLETHSEVPWHRVVNARGMISQRGLSGGDDYQRILLEAEGVLFDERQRIPLNIYQWQSDQ